jgi:hypothetical protein
VSEVLELVRVFDRRLRVFWVSSGRDFDRR